MFLSFLFAAFALVSATENATNVITLTNNNFVSLVGPVTGPNIDSVLQLMNDAALQSHIKSEKQVYLYLNTPGGSVIDGYRLIQHIRVLQAQQVSVDCIGQTFISMGFAIMQTCTRRFIMSHSIGMQHPLSTFLGGALQNIRGQLDMVEAMHEDLMAMELKRLSMTREVFEEKILRDWWMFGIQAIRVSAADSLVLVQCAPEVTDLFIQRSETILDTTFHIRVNKCPLINTIHTEEKNGTKYFNTANYRTEYRSILRDVVGSTW